MGVVRWLKRLVGFGAGLIAMANIPIRSSGKDEEVTVEYLADTNLQTIAKDPKDRKSYKEAVELSSLLPELTEAGVELHAVVHETGGVEEFKQFFKGDIHLDSERRFYGPKQRWMFLSGLVRVSVWRSFFRAYKKSVKGNLQGEGRLLGGLFVIGSGDKGIVLDFKEKEFGDHAPLKDVLAAVDKIKSNSKL